MYIKKRYSLVDLACWTRWETLKFFLYALIITATYAWCGLEYFQLPWTPMALIGTAVAFVVGFQNNAAYERIWEARKIWGGIVNSSRILAMQVQDFVRPNNEELSPEAKSAQRTIVLRHVGWLTALRHAMREPRPWEYSGEHRTNREWSDKICIPEEATTLQNDLSPYIPLSELDYVLSKNNKASAILFLQSRHLRKLKEKGGIWEFAHLDIEKTLGDLFVLQGQSERIKNFPYPRQYSTISHWFILLFLLLFPFGLVPEFHQMGENFRESFPQIADYFVWLAVPFCTIISWVFHTMERIGRTGENPFEGSPNDVPISTIARGIEIDILQQHNFDYKEIPEPIKEDSFVQM